jgi:hypothetical protein
MWPFKTKKEEEVTFYDNVKNKSEINKIINENGKLIFDYLRLIGYTINGFSFIYNKDNDYMFHNFYIYEFPIYRFRMIQNEEKFTTDFIEKNLNKFKMEIEIDNIIENYKAQISTPEGLTEFIKSVK